MKDRPKMFLPAGETTIVDTIFADLEADDRIDTVYVLANPDFAPPSSPAWPGATSKNGFSPSRVSNPIGRSSGPTPRSPATDRYLDEPLWSSTHHGPHP
jgi:hypothetical protein